MSTLNRRRFLTLVGVAPIAAAAGAGLGSVGSTVAARAYSFRATAGLPHEPLPTWGTYILEGHVDLSRGTGVIHESLHAGAPGATSEIVLPGTSRAIRVTGVRERGSILSLRGVLQDRSQLRPGEHAVKYFHVDRAGHRVSTEFFGSPLMTTLHQ